MASNDAPVNLKDEIQSDSKVEANQPKKKNRHRPHRKKNKLKSEDENPDTSEILTSPKQYPTSEWLKVVLTGKAKKSIKDFYIQTTYHSNEL